MGDSPEQTLVIRCRKCHHDIAVDLTRQPDPAKSGQCPNCGYRNVFGLDPSVKTPHYPQR